MSRREELAATSALVRFLIGRIDTDQSALDKLVRAESRDADGPAPDGLLAAARLRADLVAKRHVIGDVQQLLVLRDLPEEQHVRDAALSVLRSMTLPYRNHPQYRTEWDAPSSVDDAVPTR